MAKQSIYLVWNPDGSNPKIKHDSLQAARDEAARLAELAPGSRFYVVRAIESLKKLTVPYDREVYSKNG